MRHLFLLFLTTLFLGLPLNHAAPVPVEVVTVKDRKGFIPYRKYESLPGKVVGIMLSDVGPVMGQDGRSGPPDAFAFSRNAGSYRWVYTPADKDSIIQQLQVKVGEMGDKVKVYPHLNMANARTLAPWKVEGPVALVEVEINDGLGAPADEGFVASRMRRVDGTREFPLELPKVLADLRKQYEDHQKTQQATLERAMTAAQKKWLGEQKPTGPREKSELMYVTWMAEKQRVRVYFQTRMSDGAYTYVEGGANIDRPFPLPPPPLPPNPGKGFVAFPPPPPRLERVRIGTTFGIEYGRGYEVAKDGELVRILDLPPEGFGQELPVPPGAGGLPQPGGRPIRP